MIQKQKTLFINIGPSCKYKDGSIKTMVVFMSLFVSSDDIDIIGPLINYNEEKKKIIRLPYHYPVNSKVKFHILPYFYRQREFYISLLNPIFLIKIIYKLIELDLSEYKLIYARDLTLISLIIIIKSFILNKDQRRVLHITGEPRNTIKLWKNYFKKFIYYKFDSARKFVEHTLFKKGIAYIKLSSPHPFIDSNSVNSSILITSIVEKNNIISKETIFNKFHNIEKTKICFIGRLCKEKGYYEYIKIADNLIKESINREIEFIAAGPKHRYVKLNKDINYVGCLDYLSALSLMKEAHFLILPSFSDGMPKVIVESITQGCIPLAYDVGFIKYLLSGKYLNDLVFKQGNHIDVVNSLQNLMQNEERRMNIINYLHDNKCYTIDKTRKSMFLN